jgi:flagellar motor protein MotB
MARNKEENYFVSMTDMMVGILLIFILMVAFFAYKIRTAEVAQTVPKELFDRTVDSLQKKLATANEYELYSIGATQARAQMIQSIQSKLQEQGIDASANIAQGVITIPGDSLFPSGSSELSARTKGLEKVNRLAQVIYQHIECFTLTSGATQINNRCNSQGVLIDTVFIEGHTDSNAIVRQLADGSRTNLELSARRATNSYEAMIASVPALKDRVNPFGQQVLSVSAFGEQRPVANNESPKGREENRRIDIRFLMYIPRDQEGLARFKEGFEIQFSP